MIGRGRRGRGRGLCWIRLGARRMSVVYPFFASSADVIELWKWIGDIQGIRLLEADSKPDAGLRQFDCFPAEEWSDPQEYLSIVAWPSMVSTPPIEKEIKFNETGRLWSGGSGRTSLVCPAFIRIAQVNSPNPDFWGFNELVYETKASARPRFHDDQIAGVDWLRFGKLIGQIKKHIQKSAAGKWRSIPVSNHVAVTLREEGRRLWYWGHEGTL